MKKQFTFADLFAGIGGFHIAMNRLGGKCVFASEFDLHARKTYEANFIGIEPELFKENFNEDIRTISPNNIPDFDVLCAGFPCQPFSQAGYKRGFLDNHNSERGNLFFYIADIIQEKQPKAFFLENVRGLLTHDGGKTFKIIRTILEKELGYNIFYKIISATDYGLPQLRPRLFIIGFRGDLNISSFDFPPTIPLKYTMNDVWNGKCNREIGYTLRVGGRGSALGDRRNWDRYLVDGIERKISQKEAKKMQGFPDNYIFPVSETQAMKQLGNSVAIDAVQAVANSMLQCINFTSNTTTMKVTKNKGERTELVVFLKLLLEKEINLSTDQLQSSGNMFFINKITNKKIDKEFLLNRESSQVIIKEGDGEKFLDINSVLNSDIIKTSIEQIKAGEKTFELPILMVVQEKLGLDYVKGGDSNEKSDIILGIKNNLFHANNEGFGIKSYLGAKPTLLNASSNTNFIFKVEGLSKKAIDIVNAINSRTKIIDRIQKIESLGGRLEYKGAEKEEMEYNLRMVDSAMPQLVGDMLLSFYKDRLSGLEDIVTQLVISEEERALLRNKLKNLLMAILLGFFPGTKRNGEYASKGTIVMDKAGECLCFHIVEIEHLKNFLFQNIKLDTPSSSRHKFGNLYLERDGNLYFKLNLQLRFL